jgi:hypothetical protein
VVARSHSDLDPRAAPLAVSQSTVGGSGGHLHPGCMQERCPDTARHLHAGRGASSQGLEPLHEASLGFDFLGIALVEGGKCELTPPNIKLSYDTSPMSRWGTGLAQTS